MKKDQRDKLRHEIYTLWYNAKDKDKKIIYQKVLDLIDYTEDVRSLQGTETSLKPGCFFDP